jgi:hypothetical protein
MIDCCAAQARKEGLCVKSFNKKKKRKEGLCVKKFQKRPGVVCVCVSFDTYRSLLTHIGLSV